MKIPGFVKLKKKERMAFTLEHNLMWKKYCLLQKKRLSPAEQIVLKSLADVEISPEHIKVLKYLKALR